MLNSQISTQITTLPTRAFVTPVCPVTLNAASLPVAAITATTPTPANALFFSTPRGTTLKILPLLAAIDTVATVRVLGWSKATRGATTRWVPTLLFHGFMDTTGSPIITTLTDVISQAEMYGAAAISTESNSPGLLFVPASDQLCPGVIVVEPKGAQYIEILMQINGLSIAFNAIVGAV